MENTPATSRPLIFGEVLFDCFPDGQAIMGGAPFNVAWNLRMLGTNPVFVGAVGADPLGTKVRAAMAAAGLDPIGLQTVPLPTGQVTVTLADGEPHYEILSNQAYDAIAAAALPAVPVPMLYHGSLALRAPTSLVAWGRLREHSAQRFVDVNLRAPWYREEQVRQWLQGADFLKMNSSEAESLFPGLEPAQMIAQAKIGRALILTHGAAGAAIYTADGGYWQAAAPPVINFQDPVGAGDAFASAVLFGILHAWDWPEILQRALRFAARTCSLRGGTTTDPSFYTLN